VILHKCIQLFQLRLSPEQSGKVEYERERLLGIANKFIHLLAIPSTFRARIRLFRFARGTTLIEIAVIVVMILYILHILKQRWYYYLNISSMAYIGLDPVFGFMSSS
jgi:hypothetical protein